MSKALILFNSWIEDENIGCFWEVQTIPVYSIEDIEEMSYKKLKHLLNKMYDYECSYKNCKKISPDWVDGYKYVKQHLKDLESNYYIYILNTKFKNRPLLQKQIKDCFLQDNNQTKTYYDVYHEAEAMVLSKYAKKNTLNYLQLKEVTDTFNLKQIVEDKEKQLKYINSLTLKERNDYYKKIRIEKDPKKEEEKNQQSLINLKQWREANPDKLKAAQRRAMKKYNENKQDLTTCQTDEELALKLTRNAIAKALKKLDDAQRYKLKQELKLGLVE